MTVKKKMKYPEKRDISIEEVINRGGKVLADEKSVSKEVRFTLRIPRNAIEAIDKERKHYFVNKSRNQWILEAIAEKLNAK